MTKYLKAVVAFTVAVVGGGIAQGLINGAAAAWCTIVIGALATAGVYRARNTTPKKPAKKKAAPVKKAAAKK